MLRELFSRFFLEKLPKFLLELVISSEVFFLGFPEGIPGKVEPWTELLEVIQKKLQRELLTKQMKDFFFNFWRSSSRKFCRNYTQKFLSNSMKNSRKKSWRISVPGSSGRIPEWTSGGTPEGSAEIPAGTSGGIQNRFSTEILDGVVEQTPEAVS